MRRYTVALRVAGVMGNPPRDIQVVAEMPDDVVRPEAYISAHFVNIWPDCKVLSVSEITELPSPRRTITREDAARASLALILTVLFDYAVTRRLMRQTTRQFARKWVSQLAAALATSALVLAIRKLRS